MLGEPLSGGARRAVASYSAAVTKGRYVVMGVSGSGKSLIGAAFARTLGVEFVEGDKYHPPENVDRMSRGIPLTDEDRSGWLRALATRLREARDGGDGLVLTCSALKRSYRDVLRAGAGDLQLVFLRGPRALIAQRLANRRGHFMPAALLDSQLATLEEPTADEAAWVCDISNTPDDIVASLGALASGRGRVERREPRAESREPERPDAVDVVGARLATGLDSGDMYTPGGRSHGGLPAPVRISVLARRVARRMCNLQKTDHRPNGASLAEWAFGHPSQQPDLGDPRRSLLRPRRAAVRSPTR
jgi:gluconokinase